MPPALPTRWIVLAAASLGMGAAYGGISTISILIGPFETEFGWLRSDVSFAYTLLTLGAAAGGLRRRAPRRPAADRADRHGRRAGHRARPDADLAPVLARRDPGDLPHPRARRLLLPLRAAAHRGLALVRGPARPRHGPRHRRRRARPGGRSRAFPGPRHRLGLARRQRHARHRLHRPRPAGAVDRAQAAGPRRLRRERRRGLAGPAGCQHRAARARRALLLRPDGRADDPPRRAGHRHGALARHGDQPRHRADARGLRRPARHRRPRRPLGRARRLRRGLGGPDRGGLPLRLPSSRSGRSTPSRRSTASATVA
jgi:hypothetical protein